MNKSQSFRSYLLLLLLTLSVLVLHVLGIGPVIEITLFLPLAYLAFRTLSGQERMALQIRERERQLSAAQRLAHIGSWEWDIATNTVTWSEELYRIYGVDPERFTVNYENFIARIHPDDRDAIQGAIQKAYGDHQPFEFHHRILRDDRDETILYGRGDVIVDGSGKALRMLGTAQDVTELRQAERRVKNAYEDLENQIALRTAELVTANRKLETEVLERKRVEATLRETNAELTRLNEARLAFASMVSHELRTPLAAIKSGIDMVMEGIDGPVTESQTETLSISKNNVDRLNRLISNILDYTRLTTGTMDMQCQPCALGEFMEEVWILMKREAEKKNVTLALELPSGPVGVQCDADKVKTVIINLVHNAIKFTPAGGTVHMRLKSATDSATIEVQDTGKGMTQETQSNIFELFRQGASDEGALNPKGFGVGLAVAKLVTEMHQGEIRVDSAPGKGAKFTVTFPRSRSGPSGMARGNVAGQALTA